MDGGSAGESGGRANVAEVGGFSEFAPEKWVGTGKSVKRVTSPAQIEIPEMVTGPRNAFTDIAKVAGSVKETRSDAERIGGERVMGMPGEAKGIFVVFVRGLPWSVTRDGLVGFFDAHGIGLAEGGVHLVTNRKGKPMGHAYVKLATREDAEKALDKNGQYMAGRYLEISKSKYRDMEKAMARSGKASRGVASAGG